MRLGTIDARDRGKALRKAIRRFGIPMPDRRQFASSSVLARCNEKTTQAVEQARPPWTAHIMRAKLTWLGLVEARDEAEALAKAVEQLNVCPADRWRISVRRA